MTIKTFEDLQSRLSSGSPKTLVVVAAHDKHVLEAVLEATIRLPIDYKLVGDKNKIIEISKSLNWEIPPSKIIESSDDQDSAALAVNLIKQGKGDVLMKGILETSTLLKAVLNRESGLRDLGGHALMSHIAVLEVPSYKKLIFITDGGMIPHPTLDQKKLLVKNSVNFLKSLGYTKPKVAALAAVETVSEKLPETVEAAELRKMYRNGEFEGCILEGPISFDLSVNPKVAEIKQYKSEISGDVDVFLVPEMTTGNVLSKSLIAWNGAKMAGCILGVKNPIVLTSRGSSAEEKFLSILLCTCSCD